VGFCFSKAKGRARRTRAVVNVVTCNENFFIKTILTKLTTPFLKNFFQKLFRVENTTGSNTRAFSVVHNMGQADESSSASI
jgi:hypothetical protein